MTQQTTTASAPHHLTHVSQAAPEQLVMLQLTVVMVLVQPPVASQVSNISPLMEIVTVEIVNMAPATQVQVHLVYLVYANADHLIHALEI